MNSQFRMEVATAELRAALSSPELRSALASPELHAAMIMRIFRQQGRRCGNDHSNTPH